MSYNAILSDLKKRAFKPLYFFDGDEPYFIDKLTDYIINNVLNEAEREFNQSILYGQDVSPQDLVPIVKRYPMMAEYQVIVVKEAQNWKKPDALEALFENPVPTSILVINYKNKKLDGRSKLIKSIKAKGVYFNSSKLRDYEITGWINNYCKDQEINIDPRAAALLSENIGTDLSHLVNSLDKLKILVPQGETITVEMVYKNIGISKDFNVFELQRAIGLRDDRKALLIANYFARNTKEHHIIPVMSNVYRYFNKLMKYHSLQKPTDKQSVARHLGVNPYFADEYIRAAANYPMGSLMEAINVLHDIDLKSKGVTTTNSDAGELMKEMVSRLLRA